MTKQRTDAAAGNRTDSRKDNKNTLRRIMRAKRAAISRSQKQIMDEQLCRQLLLLPFYPEAKRILTYVSMEQEADTRQVIRRALDDKKEVAVPLCMGEGRMDFYRIESPSELKPGTMGIDEPSPHPQRLVEGGQGIMLVPGLAFDRSGGRLGWGGGYYDRYMALHPGLIRIGYGYSFQMVDHLPMEEHDICLDGLLTELGYVHIRKESTAMDRMPKDPMILLSYVNTALRDRKIDLTAFCKEMGADEEAIRRTLEAIDYRYDALQNRFI